MPGGVAGMDGYCDALRVDCSHQIFVYLSTAAMLVVVGYFVSVAWRMVPFAAVNLKGALEGINRNCGMYVVACVFAELGFCWVIYWLYVVVGVSGYQNSERRRTHSNVDPETLDNICGPPFVVVIAVSSFVVLDKYCSHGESPRNMEIWTRC